MKTNLAQEYGPLLSHAQVPDITPYLWISEQSFIKCSEHVNKVRELYSTPEGRVFTILMYHALNTSYSVRFLTTHAYLLEAHALLRTRLEQVIKCSYLIYADPEKGLKPFMHDAERVDDGMSQYIKKQDPELFNLIARIFPDNLEEAKRRAIENEKLVDPTFNPEEGVIKEGWTNLNTYAMAQKRDSLVPQDDPISSIKLRWYYLTLYKSACKYIHSGSACLTNNFIGVANSQLGPQPAYLFSNLVQVAHLDLIQCYEILCYFKASGKDDFTRLLEKLEDLIPFKELFGR